MRDLNAAQQEVRSLPREALEKELRAGSGNIPEFIVMAELDSRASMQGNARRPKITVRDEMMMGLPPPQQGVQPPTNGFAAGGLVGSYLNPYLGQDEFGKQLDAAARLTEMQNLRAKNQPELEAPSGLQSLTKDFGMTALNMPEPAPGLREPVRFASGGVVGGQAKYTREELDLLAQAMASEAGNQSKEGLYGVGYNILNRVGNDKYPDSLKGVILQDGQYSAFNDITGYAGGEGANPSGRKYTDAQYRAAEDVAYGRVENPIGDATNYYNPALASPSWGPGMSNKVTIGDHVFGTAGSGSAQTASYLPRPRPTSGATNGTTNGTEMVNLTSEPEDNGLATILASMAEKKRKALPKRDLRMQRATYSDDDKEGLRRLIESYGSNV